MQPPSLKELPRTRWSRQDTRVRTSLPQPPQQPLPSPEDNDSQYSKTAISSAANSHSDTPFIASIITKIRSVERLPLPSTSSSLAGSPNTAEKVGQTVRKKAMRGSAFINREEVTVEDGKEEIQRSTVLEQRVKYLEFSLAAWQQKCQELESELAQRHAQAEAERQRLTRVEQQLRAQLVTAQAAIQQLQPAPRQLKIEQTSSMSILPMESSALREAQLTIRKLQVEVVEVEKKLHHEMRQLQQRKDQEVALMRKSYASNLRHYKSQVMRGNLGGSTVGGQG